jgi:hypothetical protein
MSVDSVARALAIQAQPVDTLATGIGSVSIPAVNKVFRTKGYGALGKGIGLYVADSLANAALAAAHPRFCKLSADGRYWRLSVEDGLNVLAAGAIADNATDDGPAFIAALAYLKAIALTRAPYGFTRGGPKLLIPAGDYYLANSTLDITFGVVIEGDLGGKFWGAGSVLRWADGTTGIRTQASNTTGASADGPETGLNASGTIIRNLYLKGGFSGAESESHGVQLRWPAVLENMTIENFAGDGVFCRCTLGSAPWRGQSNGSAFYNVGVIVCRNGFYFDGFDSNALTFLNCDAHSNRRWGMWCETGIGNTIIGGNFSTNGTFTATPTKCLYSGNWYYCLPNQAAKRHHRPQHGLGLLRRRLRAFRFSRLVQRHGHSGWRDRAFRRRRAVRCHTRAIPGGRPDPAADRGKIRLHRRGHPHAHICRSQLWRAYQGRSRGPASPRSDFL